MSDNSLPPRPKQREAERPLNTCTLVKYIEESELMILGEAIGYFNNNLPKEFRVTEGVYSFKLKGREGETLSKDDIFIACLTKQESLLKLRPAGGSPGNDAVTVPVVTRSDFALTPLSEEDNETDAAVRSWEGVYHSVAEFFEARRDQNIPMPAALRLLDHAKGHNGEMVPAKTILFSIRQVSQRVGLQMKPRSGIEGVDYKGVTHRFLDGGDCDRLFFSTKLFDVKCLPMCLTTVLQCPQTARVYLRPDMEREEDEGVRSLQNLSYVTITEVAHDHHLVVRKLSDDGNQLGPTFTVPLSADLKVVAIKLKDSALLDSISDKRCIVRATSSPSVGPTASLADMYINPYSEDPCEETRGDIQAGRKDNDKETYYNAETLQLQRYHQYGNVQGSGAVAFVPSPVFTGSTAASATGRCVGGTMSEDMNDIYEYMNDSKLSTSVATGSKQLPQPSKPSPPCATALPGHSNKMKPKGLPSTATPLTQPVSTRTQHPPHVSKEPIMLTSRPKEPELRFHVAARLGLDWHKVCTYLGLQLHQLDVDATHSQLEDKAMQALVMWLRGQEHPKAPHSWGTLVEALRWARRNDIASDLEMGIKNGTLAVALSNYR